VKGVGLKGFFSDCWKKGWCEVMLKLLELRELTSSSIELRIFEVSRIAERLLNEAIQVKRSWFLVCLWSYAQTINSAPKPEILLK